MKTLSGAGLSARVGLLLLGAACASSRDSGASGDAAGTNDTTGNQSVSPGATSTSSDVPGASPGQVVDGVDGMANAAGSAEGVNVADEFVATEMGSAGGAGDADGENGATPAAETPGAPGGEGEMNAGSVLAAGVRWLGRVDTGAAGGPRFGWSGAGFVARFTGSGLSVQLNNTGAFVFKAVIDDVPQPAFTVSAGQGTYQLASGLEAGTHTAQLLRQTEGSYGDSQLLGIAVEGGALIDPAPASGRLIEVVGASVSCGYGNLGVAPCGFSFATESHWDSYDAVVARAVSADLNVVAISGRGVYRNYDGTTEGAMPQLFDRILANSPLPRWDFPTTPQAVIINLGKNDFSVGEPGPAFRDAYLTFTRTLRSAYPEALIICTTGPNLGDAVHARQLAEVSAAIEARRAEGDTKIELVDWPEMTADEIGCDFHPTAAKHERMAEQVVAVLRAQLGW